MQKCRDGCIDSVDFDVSLQICIGEFFDGLFRIGKRLRELVDNLGFIR